MNKVSAWFQLRRIAINEYFETVKQSCTPWPGWWVQIMIIDYFAARATNTFKQVQDHGVTVCQQRAHIAPLQAFYLNAINGKGFLQESEANALDGDKQWLLLTCRGAAENHAE